MTLTRKTEIHVKTVYLQNKTLEIGYCRQIGCLWLDWCAPSSAAITAVCTGAFDKLLGSFKPFRFLHFNTPPSVARSCPTLASYWLYLSLVVWAVCSLINFNCLILLLHPCKFLFPLWKRNEFKSQNLPTQTSTTSANSPCARSPCICRDVP